MKRILLLVLAVLLPFSLLAQNKTARPLQIYFVDVEGGAATLVVTPAGESLLFDCGWARPDGRDAKRIAAAAKQAGIQRIDYLVTTHFHADHWGGLGDLAKQIPIGKFYDHGVMSELPDDKTRFPQFNETYRQVTGGKSQALRAGDRIPLRGAPGTPPVRLDVLAANGEVGDAKTGDHGTPNPACASAQLKNDDPSDNARSVGAVLTFGKFRFLDLGDLTWNVEQKLVCPSNRIGKIALYQVTHHGMNISNNPALLNSVSPQVAVMNNGPKKGGSPDVVKWLRAVPGIEDIYQLHRNIDVPEDQNVAAERIANLGPEQDCPGNGVQVVVAPDGNSFTVTNTRTRQSRRTPTTNWLASCERLPVPSKARARTTTR